MFQTGVLLFSTLQSDNSTLNFLYAIGAHLDCSKCAPLFYVYAILRDRNTHTNDSLAIYKIY